MEDILNCTPAVIGWKLVHLERFLFLLGL